MPLDAVPHQQIQAEYDARLIENEPPRSRQNCSNCCAHERLRNQ